MEEESPTRHHPHHLSSLVVRPTDSGGGGSDYEPGEVRRDPPPHSRSDRYNDSSGHVGRADSFSPLRYRNVDSRYRPNFNNSSGPHTTRSDSVSPPQHDRYRPDFNNSNGPHMTRSNSVSPLHHDRYRPDFNNSNGPHMARSDSASPVSHKKVDDRYRTNFNNGSHMARSDSVSPVHHDRYRPNFNNSNGPQKTRSDSASPFRHGKVDDRYKPDYNNTSGGPHEGSVSPFGHRNADDRCRPDFDTPISPHVMHPNSVSPLRQRRSDNRHRPEFVNLRGPQRGRGFVGGRGPGSRFRDFSPPYGRARGLGRPYGFNHAPPRNDGMHRPFPNVSPREGDWMCPDPSCGNLNFARRHICNKCHKSRFGPGVGPRRNYPCPPRFNGPAFGRSLDPPRFNGPPFDRSPPRGDWGRGGGPREFNTGPPHFRQGGRFPREIQDYPEEDEFDERERFGRSVPPPEWGPRDRDFNGRRGFESRNERRSLSPLPLPPPPPLPLPPPLPSRDRWRERSRSPIMMNGPPKDHPRDSVMGRGRGRGARWGMGRDRGHY